MDAGTFYLRVFLGAKPFRSAELDSLADRMKVSDILRGDAGERYFLTKTNAAAICVGGKILFGEGYYSSLTESQRLAVAAHEFGHVLGDGVKISKRLAAPAAAVSTLMALSAFLGTGSVVALIFTTALGFVTGAALWSSLDSERYLKHEMRCDRLASSFVDKGALVEAIRAAESMRRSRKSRIASVWRRASANTFTRLRVDAILGIESQS